MSASGRPSHGWTRRALLSGFTGLGLSAAQRAGHFPPEQVRFLDPATEFELVRLTQPSHSSFLTGYSERSIARRGNFLLYYSDRTGTMQSFRMDLRSGQSEQITEARELDGSSISMLPDERSFCHFDGPVLRQTNLANLRGREIYPVPDGWTRGEGATVSGDGVHAVFVERSGERYRLRLVGVAKGDALSVLEANEPIRHPVPRPRRAGILYRRGDSLWLVNYDGQQDRPLRLSPGRTGPARWSADGRTIVYLSFSGDERNLSSLREHTPDTHADQLIANTSQFIQFACNGDSSVFVGASSSKAFPYVLILLRVTARELTICEHRASDPAQVAPIFSPDSQQVFFQSDKEGRMAIYAMNIARLVERIES